MDTGNTAQSRNHVPDASARVASPAAERAPPPTAITPRSTRSTKDARRVATAGFILVRWAIGAAALAAFGTVLWFATRPSPLTVQGEVSADRVDISPRVAGGIAKLGAAVGDTVERGAVIAELDSPKLVATLAAVRANAMGSRVVSSPAAACRLLKSTASIIGTGDARQTT